MKIDRLDVAYDEIIETCDEFMIASVEFKSDEEFITRLNVNTQGDLLKEVLVDEMIKEEKFANFMIEVINEYNQQKSLF